MNEVCLGDALELIIDHRGKTPKKLGGDFTETGVPVVSAIHIKDGVIQWSERERYVSPQMFAKWMPQRLKKGDVLLTSEAPLGQTALVPSDDDLVLSQRLFALRGKKGVLDSSYLRYFLASEVGQRRLHDRATGTTVVGIRQSELVRVLIPLPSLDEQRIIAGVLGALDDLIEIDRKLIADLDGMSKQLGHQLLMSPESTDLVPFGEIADISKGYSYKSSELVDGDGWLVNLKNVGRGGEFQARGFKPLSALIKPHHVVENGTVVVALTDLTQDRQVIARPVRVRRGTFSGRLVASLDLAVVRPSDHHTPESLFAILDHDDFRNHALGYCNGTTVLHMGVRALPDYMAPSLSADEITRFTMAVAPLRKMADELNLEISQLEETRNELLPLLMSGRIRAKDIAA
jgi:type I restriction enzyme S subunit